MIPIHRCVVSDYSKKLVNEVLDSGNLVQGKMVKRFEEEFAEISGAKYAAATSNGTTSLEMMMRADGVDEDYVVFTNPLSFAATPRAIRHVGATPIFIDVEYETGNIDQVKLHQENDSVRSHSKTTTLVVDLHGVQDPLVTNNIPIYRDASQAHESKLDTDSVAASYSFHASKNITAGEGGMVVSNDFNLIEDIKLLRNHGMNSYGTFKSTDGYNARMTDLQAAIGIGSLRDLPEINAIRTDNARYYDQSFSGIDSLKLPATQYIYHHYCLRSPFADQIITILRYEGIDTRKYYSKPLTELPEYEGYELSNRATFPNAYMVCEESFCIPVHQHLTKQEKDYIVKKVIQAVEHVNG